MERQYICIDLKSFYASVECVERGLDPLKANLVVADASRTEKTICLAVSPALKEYKIPGRARLFEVVQRVKEVNQERARANGGVLCGKSYISDELKENKALALDYIAAPPRMALYMKYSTEIYEIYLKYIAHEDIHVYSVDEVFIDATRYLKTYNMTARELTLKMVKDVLNQTGITATAGIGTNMYLAKIAMDIEAKKMPADKDGVRIAELDEMSYRERLWSHTPITDFWRIGKGYKKKLQDNGMFTMGDVARRSVYDEDRLYKLFGVNAELLIDHAWGYEPCTIQNVKEYVPENRSLSEGQVLKFPYSNHDARIVISEMADNMIFDLTDKELVTNQVILNIGYDIENVKNGYKGEITKDFYGRAVPKPAHGSANLSEYTASSKEITKAVLEVFDRITDKSLTIRRMNITVNNVIPENKVQKPKGFEQLDLFTDYDKLIKEREKETAKKEKEKRLRKTIVGLKKQYGKNAVLKGTSLEENATAIERNGQIGGHKA